MSILSITIILLSNAVSLRRDLSILFNRIAIISLIFSILYSVSNTYLMTISKGIALYGGLFQTTSTAQIFHIFVFIITACILVLTAFFPTKLYSLVNINNNNSYNSYKNYIVNEKVSMKMEEHIKIIEYPLIILFIITGSLFLISTNDLVSIFLAIELQSYGLYLLSSLYRNSESAVTGGLTYFLLGGLSSCFILLSTALLYANSGTTSLEGIYILTDISSISNSIDNITYQYNSEYINISLLIMCIGFLFKVSAAPFHFWSPDVYDAIPTIVTTFVAIIAKISIFVFLLDIVHYTKNVFLSYPYNWTTALLVSSIISMIIGTVLGLTQTRIKKLLAYSTISHVGFILLALVVNNVESNQAFTFYLMQYSISNLNVFVILVTIGFIYYYYTNSNKNINELPEKYNSPIQYISQLKGLFYINPMLALSFTITIFSFAGIPPLIGFFGKQIVLSAAIANGYIFSSLVAILTSIIGGVYYLNIIKEMFFFKSDYTLNISNSSDDISKLFVSSALSIIISIITLIILLFMFIYKEWLSLTNILAILLFNI
jgi:NADH-ubiquinone oxidoreductase chain 2